MNYKTLVPIAMAMVFLACGDDNSDDDSDVVDTPPPIEAQFGVYGAMAGDYELTYNNRTLIGTSDDGFIFDVSSYERFIIYIPLTSEKILFDAIGLDSFWVDSAPGTEYAHYTSNVNPTNSTWEISDAYIEGAPDGFTIENTVGRDSYYSFSTLDAASLIIYVQ